MVFRTTFAALMLSRALLIQTAFGVKISTNFACMFFIPVKVIEAGGSGTFARSGARIV